MNESELTRRLLKCLREDHGCLMFRIENVIGTGLPDMWGATREGWQFWIETKVVKKLTHEPRFQRSQPLVHELMKKHHVRMFVVIGADDGYELRYMNQESGNRYQRVDIHGIVATLLYHVRNYHSQPTNGI